MFAAAIERASLFTRPIHTILRYYGSAEVHRGTATLFFVNAEGWALTCRHVALELAAADQLLLRYRAFKAERDALTHKQKRQQERDLERKHGFGKGKVAEMKVGLVNCVDGPLNLAWTLHPTVDVALLKFSNFTALRCATFPVFGQDSGAVKQGKFLCRLGFPFPEFTNFAYDAAADAIDWAQQGNQNSPQFPIEGMVTRYLVPAGAVVGFEMSTPGLRGQSGGPAFDTEGRVWGMQAATNHLDLDFDVDVEVVRAGEKKRVKDSAFLHVGHCVHVDVIKAFMREHGVTFAEG